MNANNAIKKLERAGFTVTQSGPFIIGRKAGHYNVELCRNGGDYSEDISTIGTRHDAADLQSDYSGKTFWDTLAQAIRYSARCTQTQPA